jgi:hypothetical protein
MGKEEGARARIYGELRRIEERGNRNDGNPSPFLFP